ncbi:Hypothetical protein HEAR2104 [Herminiimonas arsenicoxydans]|uniref:Uncharacterized protein n=1 Tax=Herminiimonas arsenicoxydans TaxID=204773 RepID=A4G6V5_HERAR|nr:Hypothetical protein HEAR2104 [Herminiimonas arsenicoxydans]
MSHTDVEQHHGYSVHGTSEKHDTGKWVGSFHIAQHGIPGVSISVTDAIFDSSEEAALHALRQGRLYIDRKLVGNQ